MPSFKHPVKTKEHRSPMGFCLLGQLKNLPIQNCSVSALSDRNKINLSCAALSNNIGPKTKGITASAADLIVRLVKDFSLGNE